MQIIRCEEAASRLSHRRVLRAAQAAQARLLRWASNLTRSLISNRRRQRRRRRPNLSKWASPRRRWGPKRKALIRERRRLAPKAKRRPTISRPRESSAVTERPLPAFSWKSSKRPSPGRITRMSLRGKSINWIM